MTIWIITSLPCMPTEFIIDVRVFYYRTVQDFSVILYIVSPILPVDQIITVAGAADIKDRVDIDGSLEESFVDMADTDLTAVEMVERNNHESWSDGVPTQWRVAHKKPGVDGLEEHKVFGEVIIGDGVVMVMGLHILGSRHHGGKAFHGDGVRGGVFADTYHRAGVGSDGGVLS